ncbi:MAG: hypothetical protein PHS93_08740 [Candidatus Omnitrophica bacterium]|nr:hypothetical protein [Candidatus Omnitrophota bacterium]
MQQAKTTEYKDIELLDDIMESTIRFMDENKNPVSYKARDIFKAYCPSKATPAQLLEFKMKVEALGLDPCRGEVWMSIFDEYEFKDGKKIKIGEKVVILTNYMVYVKRAWASEKMDTFKIDIEKPSKDPQTWTAKFMGRRKGMSEPFETPPIPVSELNKQRNVWNISPTVMTVVRMTSLGLRWMMADVLGGMPYTVEEMQSGLTETGSEHKIEDSVDEETQAEIEKELAEKERVKKEYLFNLKDAIGKLDSIEKVEAFYLEHKKEYDQSAMKIDIIKLFADRKQALISKAEEPKISRTELINKIVAITNEKVADVNSYVSDEMLASDTMILELLAGNAEAVPDFKRNLHEYLQSVNDQPEATYEQQPE